MAFFKKLFLCFLCFTITQTSINTHNHLNLYHQINSEIVTKIDVENPTLEDQQLITACQLTDHHGSQQAPAPDSIWETIVTLQMITEVLPRLQRTNTIFGYLSLVQQCAQMTSDITKLNQKTNLIRYLDAHLDVFSQLNSAIKRTIQAEGAFLTLCKIHSEEEDENQKKIDRKLYYTSPLGSLLNENGLALGFWTRSNQLHTLAWYIIPTICFSNAHKAARLLQDQISLSLLQKDCIDNLSATEKQQILELKVAIEKNPIAAQKAYRDLVDNIKKIDGCKQTDLEKHILATSIHTLFLSLPNFWQKSKSEIFKYLSIYTAYFTKHSVVDGIYNAPTTYIDGAKCLTNYVKSQYQNPLYNDIKESLASEGWKHDKHSTKILSGTMAAFNYAIIAGNLSLYPFILYKRYQSTKELFDLVANKQKDLVQISYLIRSIQQIHDLLQSNPSLQSLIPESAKLAELFDSCNEQPSDDLKALVNHCLSSSFTQEAYWLSQQGKILATHHLFMRIKHELVPYLQAFGAIDAYLSSYKLYAEFRSHPNARTCIPEFIQHERPQLLTENFWHPLINPEIVVTNSLSMGINDRTANLLITGPNAGGKTTSLMALLVNIIMAQSYGIATASSLSFTPFEKIHSYLDITTNLIDGESLFKAEVNRSKRLKESILSCSPDQKTFTIIDELFSGTNPDVASTVGLKFAELLSNISHSMCIITTHFPKITEAEETTGRFTNFKVADAHIAQDGTIKYPFKLEKGRSTQNIAQHMLEQEGII